MTTYKEDDNEEEIIVSLNFEIVYIFPHFWPNILETDREGRYNVDV